jgi:peptidoglycan hydrolase-like protein with peptidoglycan-binding domain
MQCPNCTAENPTDNQFCSKCGSNLNLGEQAIDRRVERILQECFKDRGLVEYDLSEKLTTRFSTYLKIAGWVFAPAFFFFSMALAMAVYWGFKTSSDAQKTIHDAAEQVVKEIQGKAQSAEKTIEASTQEAQRTINSYGQSPALKSSIEDVKRQAQKASSEVEKANSRVAAVMRSAEENQQKLAKLNEARIASPDTTLGQLNPSFLSPSSPLISPLTGISRPLFLHPFYLNLYSASEDIKKVQTGLKERDCYKGEVTGQFDDETLNALKAFNEAKGGKYITSMPGNSASILGNSLGSPGLGDMWLVDDELWGDSDSWISKTKCKNK